MNMKTEDKPSEWVKDSKCSVQVGKSKRPARYNNTDMREITICAMDGFAKRLTALRMARGISAREMSLSIGMTANYINSIESGENYPSMAMFFEICDYLKLSPKEFFGYTELKTEQREELKRHIDRLDSDKVELILKLVKLIEN